MSEKQSGVQENEVNEAETVAEPAQVAQESEVIDVAEAVATAVKAATEEMRNQQLRLQADFENFRRRTRLEKEDAAKYASLPVMTGLLPALDNLERAMAASKQSQDFDTLAKGVEMTAKQLLEALVKEGLQPMVCVGEPFNPEYHQAVLQVESDEYDDGVIVEVLQSGYLLKDRVIRPAMVKVNSKQ